MAKKLDKAFAIKINNVQEMVTVRETLRALGYRIFYSFDTDNHFTGYKYVIYDLTDISRAGNSGDYYSTKFANIQECLDAHFQVFTPNQIKANSLREQIKALEEEIEELEAE